ncbi:hypothetical protein [Vibrio lentus]|uniref:Uncharacterized protein n=1 Tax=Vibrio lentus TaxID=136468 RepID=A0A2N7C5C4_9VIBR|nr:hypothetical protein [Vibrio lentus]PME53004.1 hypothetical protein BCV34_22855 [Vibrio lentus]PME70259.1 hypothetical protein BCV30_22475 [Vibrio lentus]PME87345.1 hypothetical protein BCV27_22865 [Vibrio lentus]PMG73656.1 hypothetical protein BCU86_23205 [Vibrio lentus]PMH92684.1 hypothetical protein BCU56_23290 [Vibrio lentus]
MDEHKIMDEEKMEDYQTKGTAHGTKGSLIRHHDSTASKKLIERYGRSEMQRASSLKTAELVASTLGSLGSVLGAIPSEKEQEEFKVTLKNTTDYIYVPRQVRMNGNLYAQSNFTTLGPGESGDLKCTVNNDTNLENGNVDIHIKGLVVGGDSESSGSVELDMFINGPEEKYKAWTIYRIRTDTYGEIHCNDTHSGSRKQRLTVVEFEPKDTLASTYPSFCIASYAASPTARSLTVEICL